MGAPPRRAARERVGVGAAIGQRRECLANLRFTLFLGEVAVGRTASFALGRERGRKLKPPAANPVRVLFFIGDFTPGGSEAHLVRLLERLDRSRVAPEVMVQRRAGSLLGMVQRLGITIHDLAARDGRLDSLRTALEVRRVVHRSRPDVVHAYGYPCDVIATMALAGSRSPIVLTSRRGNQPRARRRLLYRMTNRWVDRVVCVSNSSAAYAIRTEKLDPAKTTVIANGVDVSGFRPRPRPRVPATRIGTLGRLREVKGSDLLLEAFCSLERSDLVLRLAGPADSSWGRELRGRYSGRHGVEFVEFVEDTPGFLQALDVFVLPSRSEGMSNALLEAMAAGLPIVATDVGSNREVLDGGRAGIVVPPNAAGIADGIRRILMDPALAEELAGAARRRVEREFDVKTMTGRYESLYLGLASRD